MVPTIRPEGHVVRLARLAETLACPLILLVSGQASASGVLARLPASRADIFVIELRGRQVPAVPAFETTDLLLGTPVERLTDVSTKRNLGLLLAHHAGWERIFFLDDDIVIQRPDDIRLAVGLLDDYLATGLAVKGFPDGSVAGHTNLELGGQRISFLASGALAISPNSRRSFFAQIYNEDLLYLLDETGPFRVALAGTAFQEPYDPFTDPRRAASEEFGETLVIGLYYLARKGLRLGDSDERYWHGFIDSRQSLLCDLLRRLERSEGPDPLRKDKIRAALRLSLETSASISPAFCKAYVEAWLRDRRRWQTHLGGLPSGLPVGRALAELGLEA